MEGADLDGETPFMHFLLILAMISHNTGTVASVTTIGKFPTSVSCDDAGKDLEQKLMDRNLEGMKHHPGALMDTVLTPAHECLRVPAL